MKALICVGVCAPRNPSTGCPPTKAKTAGIDCTRICAAIRWFWSTSILTSFTLPFASVTAFSSAGVSVLHGPHHGAQKSTITGTSFEASMTSAMKVASVASLIGLALEGAIRSIATLSPRENPRRPRGPGASGCGLGGVARPLRQAEFRPPRCTLSGNS